MSRFLYRVPIFTPKGSFTGYEFLKVGEKVARSLYTGPEQCLNIKVGDKWIFENDIVRTSCGRFILAYCDECKSIQPISPYCGCYACDGDYTWAEVLEDIKEGKCEILGSTMSNPDLVEDIKECG